MNVKPLALIIAITSLLAACGGGGGGATSGSGSTQPGQGSGSSQVTAPTGTTMVGPNYPAATAQLQIFTAINAYRQQCGFPAFQQNTLLDKAAQNHADYMVANGATLTHTEAAASTGFSGVSPQDRAAAVGWPAALGVGEVLAGAVWTMQTLTPGQYGQSIVDAWSGGVYHQGAIADAGTVVGVGTAQKDLQGFPQVLGGLLFSNGTAPSTNMTTAGNVLTFPCQGSAGLPYKTLGEVPTPPGTSGAWGTPVTVTGNPNDMVVLTSGTMQAAGSTTVLTLTILTSSTDPAKLLELNKAVAYPVIPLVPNTSYSVNLAGTVNGVPFTRSFTFSTGNTAV